MIYHQVQSNITPSDLLTLDDSDLEIVNSPCQLNEIERLVQVEKVRGTVSVRTTFSMDLFYYWKISIFFSRLPGPI